MPKDPKLKFDAFIAQVVNDPAKPTETLLVQGFLGASSEADHTRVYADVSLESYVDIANADIVHIEPLPKEQSPLGGSYLWIRKSAGVLPGTTEPNRKGAMFLEGPIAAQAAGGPTQPAAPAAPNTVPLIVCHPTILVKACSPSAAPVFCRPSVQIVCPPSVSVVCPPSIHIACPPSVFVHCPPSLPPLLCPPPTPLCPTLPAVCFPQTINQPHCFVSGGPGCYPTPVTPQTPQTPQIGFGGQEAMGAAALPASVTAPACPITVVPVQCPSVVAHCPSVPPLTCPTHTVQCPSVAGVHCPSVNAFQCPSVAGFHCPSVQGYQCPSVAGFHCPSVQSYQCPSVAGFHCPTPNVAHCPTPNEICLPTPNPQHCPTPNLLCPPQTTHCVSVGEICPTTSPLFC